MDVTTKDELFSLADKLAGQYPAFVSPSAKCRPPNFNRDRLLDTFTELHGELRDDLGEGGVEALGGMLDALNLAREGWRCCRPHASYSAAVVKKCTKHRFWLFPTARLSAADFRR